MRVRRRREGGDGGGRTAIEDAASARGTGGDDTAGTRRRGLRERPESGLGVINPPSASVSSTTASASAPSSISASASASATASAPSSVTGPCRTSELKISLGPGGVAASRWAALLELTDVGNASCTVTGWAAIAGVTSSGTTSPATNRADSMDGLNATGVPRLTLAPGGKAGIDISGADNAAGGGSCPPPYRQLRVSAPGDSTSMTIPTTTTVFSTGLPSCAPLTASPVRPLNDFSFRARPMTGPGTTVSLILSGAVLACGALLVLSGAAKLYRAARRVDASAAGGDSHDDDSAIRAALRVNPRRWRRIEVAAGVAEAAVGRPCAPRSIRSSRARRWQRSERFSPDCSATRATKGVRRMLVRPTFEGP